MGENHNILEMRGISKAFPGVQALKKVDFFVEPGEVHCLIGANGAGKSTLMKILAGVHAKDEGEIFLDKKPANITDPISSSSLGIAVIYQDLSLSSNLSAAENIFIGKYPRKYRCIVNWSELYARAQELIDSLGIKIDAKRPVSELSMGQRQIVELAKALAAKAKLLVMDEPSATLSGEEFETLVRVINELKSKGITVIYISHKLEELFRVGDRVTVLRDGQYIATKNLKDISQDQLVELIIGHKLTSGGTRELSVSAGEEVIKLKDIHTDKLNAVKLSVNKGEILGLYGLVGSGRTEILRVIFGVDQPNNGELYINGERVKFRSPTEAIRSGIAMVPENRKTQGLVIDLPIWENAVIPSLKNFARLGVLSYKSIFSLVNKHTDKVNVVTPSIANRVGNLSGGNQQKVVIAKWLIKNTNILLFDEPTQGIDIGAKEEIYQIIKDLARNGKTVIVASSELPELLQLCNRIAVMFNGTLVSQFNQDNYQKETILRCAVAGR